MIITRAPFRLPLGGGGTDLPSYHKQFGGHLITASINKYMYVCINRPAIPDKIKLHYSKAEYISNVDEIGHPLIRESLKLHNIDSPIEIMSMADFGAGTGMGSSSAFTVALLAGLNKLRGIHIEPRDLAEEACRVEINRVRSPIGKQDQYASSIGGIIEMDINRHGSVIATPLGMMANDVYRLEERLLMFYTNITREANVILTEQGKKAEHTESTIDAMHKIKNIGLRIKESLLAGDIDGFGCLLHQHWIAKKKILDKMSSPYIDSCYELAIENGALGGKIMGAGGGGLLLLCCKKDKKTQLVNSMIDKGLRHIDFEFEFRGARVITDV